MDKKATLYYPGYSGVAYTDISDFIGKEFESSEHGTINSLIQASELFIAKQCARNFLFDLNGGSYFEICDAGNVQFFSSNFPIKEVTKIELDGEVVYEIDGANNSYLPNVDFFVHDESVEFYTIPHSATNDRNALKIYYTIEEFWGEDVKHAIKRLASETYLQREYGGKNMKGFSFAGYSLSFEGKEIPAYVTEVINTYKKILI